MPVPIGAHAPPGEPLPVPASVPGIHDKARAETRALSLPGEPFRPSCDHARLAHLVAVGVDCDNKCLYTNLIIL